MSGTMFRRGLVARGLLSPVVLAGLAARAAAQQAAKTQGFPTPDAAATALTEAVRKDDDKAVAAMLGEWWRVFVPNRERDFGRDRSLYLAAWDDNHKVTIDGDKAIVEVGKTGWTLPIPVVKDGTEWRFDSEAGIDELGEREIGRDELGAIQTLMAIVDAQREYAAMDPMKTGSPVYARRLKSLPGRKDGLYWRTAAGEPESLAGRTGRHRAGRRHSPGRPLRLQFPPALRSRAGGSRRRPPISRERSHAELRCHRLAGALRRNRYHDLRGRLQWRRL
jgi:Protein of unknown function (DUF2950)